MLLLFFQAICKAFLHRNTYYVALNNLRLNYIDSTKISLHILFYFFVMQSLTITMMSYMGKLRVAVGTEKGLIDPQKFKCSIEDAFDRIFKAAVPSNSYKSPN